jgi:hypothetical protein
MKRISLLLVAAAVLMLAGCYAQLPSSGMPEAAGRLSYAQAEYARAAAQSTQQAGQATAVARSTVDSLIVQQTQASIIANGTREAIAINATGTAVVQVAIVEAHLVADEATRVAIQREAERADVAYQVRMNGLRPWLWAAGALTLLLMAGSMAYRLWHISQPVRNGNGDIIALPSDRFQVMPQRLLPRVEEPLLLPAGNEPVNLPQITSGHVLIAATSGSGKTICLRELVDMRPGSTIVIDPHYTPGAWGAAKVIYGSEMGPFLTSLVEELETRKAARHDGQRHFDSFTVATEEMPSLVNEFGKDILLVWKRVMREGRKFGIFMMVVSQSTRVRSLGIDGEGDLLDNFNHVIELGKNAVESEPELVAGMQRPALIRSGHHAPQTIIIPYDPRKDSESDQFVPFYPFAGSGDPTPITPAAPPIINMRPAPPPVETRWGLISPQQVAQIAAMYRDGYSQRSIELQVFGHAGGSAYHKVCAVLESATTTAGVPLSGD